MINEINEKENQDKKVVYVRMTQFDLSNAIYDSKLLARVKLTPGTRLILLAMARYYNPNKPDFYPSYACLKEHLGVSAKSVERAIKELTSAGLITYITKRVNHYRFTSLFFAMVKMTNHDGQNDECDIRQNDAQTNKEKKEKNNFNFQNKNLSDGAGAEPDQEFDELKRKTEPKKENIQPKETSAQRNEKEDCTAAAAEKTPKPSPVNSLRAYKAAIKNSGVPLDEVYGYKEKHITNTSHDQNSSSKTQKTQKSSAGKYSPKKNLTTFDPNNYGGGSRVPSVEETNLYLEEKRKQREKSEGPLEFSYECAKIWYYGIHPRMRGAILPKKVAAHFGFKEDFVTPAIPYEIQGDKFVHEKQ